MSEIPIYRADPEILVCRKCRVIYFQYQFGAWCDAHRRKSSREEWFHAPLERPNDREEAIIRLGGTPEEVWPSGSTQ